MDIHKIVDIRQHLIDELLQLRKAEGYWEGRLSSDIQSTAAAIIALHLSGEKEPVKRGLKFIEGCQNTDGGWGFAPNIQSDIDSSIAALSAFLTCTKDNQYSICKKKSFKYCDEHNFSTKQLLSKLFLYFSGIDRTLGLPNINTENLPHPERMMLELAIGLKTQNQELILKHSKIIEGLRSWRGLTAITGIAFSALSMAHIDDEMTKLWLIKSQNEDGGFPHTHSLAIWDTVIASLGLIDAGVNPRSSQWLLSVQDSSGGWYWDANSMAYIDLDDIGYALLVLLKSGNSITDPRIKNAISFLKNNQNEDGGFPTFEREGISDNRPYWNCSVSDVTAHVLRALKTANLSIEAERAEKWLMKNSVNGIWKGFWFKDNLYSTVSVLETVNKKLLNLDETQKRILALQNEDGGFGMPESTIEETAWGISALIELNTSYEDALGDSVKWLYSRAIDSPKTSFVGALPLFNKCYSDSIFPLVFMLSAFTKYLRFVGGKKFD